MPLKKSYVNYFDIYNIPSQAPFAISYTSYTRYFSADMKVSSIEKILFSDGKDESSIKKNYLKMAKDFHPDGSKKYYYVTTQFNMFYFLLLFLES